LNQRVVRELLHHRGYEVDVVDGGHEAIAALKKGSYSLLVLDCMMPGLDGFATSRMIRNEAAGSTNRNIPILATTALASEDDRQRCLDAGMDDYLSKPIRANQLFERVERLIAGLPEAGQKANDAGAKAAAEANNSEQDNTRLVQNLVDSMADKLIQEAVNWETELEGLLAEQDWVAIRNLAHKIRGAADVIGLPELSRCTAALEQCVVAGDESAVAKVLGEVIVELKGMREKLGTQK
jgi:CheY-like chemotaxis protein